MDLGLKDKVIIITGGAKGIGEAIARIIAAEGAVAVIVGRSANDNNVTAQSIEKNGGKAFGIEAELSMPEECAKAVKITSDKFGRIDGLVNNAGANDGVGLESGNYERFMKSLHNNMIHYYLMAHYCLPWLKQNKGSIVNITSKTAETGQGNTSAYAAANGGRNALTREWAVELLPYSIRVNAIVVAESWTPLYESWINTFDDKESKLAGILAGIPLEKRM